ncbi:MAG: isoleucine--tRNA ligase [Hyphomonadaceae bacterium]|nr:isoleucine--tRNA ligase [Hyphomonadaceae bacterium]
MSKPEKDESSNPYKDTIFLPKTEFPMRGGLPTQEPARLAKWEAEDIYAKLRADAKARGATPFMLHDGPPYANGHIHIGTGMNKILKDLVVRTRQMTGFDADYIPGWDCHGLPIEWKVEEEFRAAGKQKRDVPMAEFRKACRDYAQKWIDIQRSEFKRLGGAGNWNDPYLTMAYSSEAATVKEFLKVAMSGQLKRGAKPVMWSPVEQTALAEAEIEYADRKANMVWVKFPVRAVSPSANDVVEVRPGREESGSHLAAFSDYVRALEGANVVIWTTTPWTIPANRAVSFNPDISYGLYEITKMRTAEELKYEPWAKVGDKLILAKSRATEVGDRAGAIDLKLLSAVSTGDLQGIILKHPLHAAGYSYDVPMLAGSHVTDDVGTGFVHTAPSHGEDDYEVWMANAGKLSRQGIDVTIPNTVDEFGRYTNVCPGFEGLEIITVDGKKRGQDGPANKAVMDKLIEAGALLARGMTTLRDAHSWRSKAPVIRRATSQWFIAMDRPLEHLKGKEGKTLRELCLQAIDDTVFTPERGRQRIRAMVEERPDWLISRQRAWGVPLTLFVDRETGVVLNTDAMNARITKAVHEGGADAWFGGDAATFFGEGYDPAKVEKINDILDVWFDSGTTHAFTLEDRGLQWPADIYLEGSDQHRGWFQSSLLESCATRGRAPYNGIVTHGFVQAEDGEKMSKSLGNVISPMDVCEKFGADILRIWVASSDYADDPSFGWNLFTANSDSYRKLRNTMRYLLGAMDGFDEKERVAYADMPGLERWVLHRLAELDKLVTEAYHAYDFKKAFHELMNFCVVDLSAVYFDIRKDSLYCDAPSSVRRRAARTVMDEVFTRLTIWFAPIMVFTCEEAWEQRHPGKGSVHLQQFPKTPDEWIDRELDEKWTTILAVRKWVTEALEVDRREKRIGSSLEAAVYVKVTSETVLRAFDDEDAAEVFITSGAEVTWDPVADAHVVVSSARVPSDWIKCARSWKYFDPTTADPAFPDITPRDAAAVREYRGL